MWYQYSEDKNKKQESPENVNNPDYHLAMSIIASMVRHRLFLQTKYNPTESQMRITTNKVVKNLEEQYGSLSVMRAKAQNENLTPVIQTAVNAVFKQKR